MKKVIKLLESSMLLKYKNCNEKWLVLEHEFGFYEQRIDQAICGFSGICGTSNGSTATQNDIDTMKRLIREILRDIHGYKGDIC